VDKNTAKQAQHATEQHTELLLLSWVPDKLLRAAIDSAQTLGFGIVPECDVYPACQGVTTTTLPIPIPLQKCALI